MELALATLLKTIHGLVWVAALSCISCGSECESACGTRHFKSCCFNYLKKRSDPCHYYLLSWILV
ncbi:hypothetical protein RI129_000792 [Pyrocoelia pectoralis]|uniref:Trissin n=1 Tax=Pyrocoelia pectoralis TaxID=417401 RepID=A0AAN7ZWE5_9COLE